MVPYGLSKIASKVTAAEECRRMLQLINTNFHNYQVVGKLMTAEWVQSQGCNFKFLSMDLEDDGRSSRGS